MYINIYVYIYHAFFRMTNICGEYLIRNTHGTFRAWFLPFSFVGGQP
jgi:hypothetical protein